MRYLNILCATFFSITLFSGVAQAIPEKTMLLKASWYGKQFHGKKMANGNRFNMYDPLTVAHKSWPLGTKIVATNIANGRTCHAVVRDRGPYIKGRSLDFSKAAADCLGFTARGTATVRVVILQ